MTVELREYHSFHLGEKRKDRKEKICRGKRPHYHRLTAWAVVHYRGGEWEAEEVLPLEEVTALRFRPTVYYLER